jgi:hypothetical protein
MGVPNKQIGWSNESNLLWQIVKQIERLIGVTSKITNGGGGDSYLKYVALLTQSGTDAPVATVLENTIGNIWFTYDAVGEYSANSDGLFGQTKTVMFMNQTSGQNGANFLALVTDNTIQFATAISGTLADEQLSYCPIEIRVYP